jgi:hypothetical protein
VLLDQNIAIDAQSAQFVTTDSDLSGPRWSPQTDSIVVFDLCRTGVHGRFGQQRPPVASAARQPAGRRGQHPRRTHAASIASRRG